MKLMQHALLAFALVAALPTQAAWPWIAPG